MITLKCDKCGGTLVMQPGAIAKCDCCGMDYSTESLRAKFVAENKSNSQTDNLIKKKELSDTAQLNKFFKEVVTLKKMLDVKKLWRECGLHEIPELHTLNKTIDVKAEFERFYGFFEGDILTLVEEWENEYGVELEDETDVDEDVV